MDVNQLPEEVRLAVDGLLREGKKIDAIKRVREATGDGLKEAKEAVEAYATAQGIAATSGCLVFLVLGVGALLALATT